MSTCDHIFWGLGPYLFVMFLSWYYRLLDICLIDVMRDHVKEDKNE